MSFGEPESFEAFFVNPAEHRNCTHAAVVGDKTGGDILRTPVLFFFTHVSLLFGF